MEDISGGTLPSGFETQTWGWLRYKYTGLVGYEMGENVDNVKDMETGLLKVQSKEEPDLMMMELPSVWFSMVSVIGCRTQSKGIPTTVVHHNTMLRESSPAQVLENMRVQGVSLMADMKVH